jgi:hypothetical protein
MTTDEFQQLWRQYDAKLDRSLQMNLRLLKDIQTQKARSVLGSLVTGRAFMIAIGSIYEVILCVCLYYVWSQPVMAVSFGAFVLITAVAIVDCIKDIVVIRRMDFSGSIVTTQEQLIRLQGAVLKSHRIAWLQLPFWSTFFVSNALLRNGGTMFWVIEIPVVAVLAGLAIFLSRNLTVANAQKKKWVRGMVRGSGFKTIDQAIGMLEEIEQFKKEG